MSRIGKNPIPIPSGVTVKINGATSVVKGPKGEHKQHIPEGMTFEENDEQLTIVRPDESKTSKARHGRSAGGGAHRRAVPERPALHRGPQRCRRAW